MEQRRLKISKVAVKAVSILLFTALGFAVMGYHPGTEDDGVYLAAVKADLNQSLYPHDSAFFRLQLQATVFDRLIASFVTTTGIPVAWADLFWQLLSLFGILWAAHSIARHLFPDPRAHWAGIAMLAAMFTLPVAGTALLVVDQHLHPRNLATALILLAIARILDRKPGQSAVLLLLALVIHPIMSAFGISFCLFLLLTQSEAVTLWLTPATQPLAAALPMSWIFDPPSVTWRRALETRRYYFLTQWTWYEWLGALGPLVLFWLLARLAQKRGDSVLARFALAVLFYGIFQQIVAILLLSTPYLVRLTPLQPMRFLHLVYLFMALISGCLFGTHLLKACPWRWALFLLVVNGSMFLAQRALFSGSEHLEFPGRQSANPWLQAFAWIRLNTPNDAYFALDPYYLAAPGENYHSFRALAERSQLADALKDAAVVTQVPQLGPAWASQVDATAGWNLFGLADFDRLRRGLGVSWVVSAYPQPPGLQCNWHNNSLSVCRLSGNASVLLH
jgi:hypothetical protein